MSGSGLALRWPARAFPTTLRAGRFPLEDRDFAYRYLAATHALHIYDYQGVLRLGKAEHALQRGDLTFTPAGVESRYHLPAPGWHWCIHFAAKPLLRTTRGGMLSLPLHLALGAEFAHAAQRVVAIASLHARGRMGSIAASAGADVALQDLLLWLAMLVEARASRRPARSEQAIDRVVEIVHTRFAEPLSAPELADEVGLSQNYLASRFRQRMGMTLPGYLITRRIDHARELLHTTDMPIRAIARRIGMPDPQHFNKQFRRLSGMSPTNWREESRRSAAM